MKQLAGMRLIHRLTQKKLAELSGIHKVAISDYETGHRKLTKKASIEKLNARLEQVNARHAEKACIKFVN